MCGRFLLSLIPEQYAGLLRIAHVPAFSSDLLLPRMNIAPTQQIIIARNGADGGGERTLAPARWGLIAPWATAADAGKRPMFNARSETAWEKPMFRSAARNGRCVAPADGFYEWKKPTSPRGRKQPHLIRRADGGPMFFAGISSTWRPKDRPETPESENCAILTTAPNQAMADVHDRMPVILSDQAAVDRWLDANASDQSDVQDLLEPEAAPELSIEAIDQVGDNRRTSRAEPEDPPTLFG